MHAYLRNDVTGEVKEVASGFSWTVLLFGFFVPLFRGDIKWAAIMLGAAMISGGLANIAFAFAYNALYRGELINRGFRPATGMWGNDQQPQHIVQQVYVNAGNGYAHVGPEPQPYDPFAARAAQAYARDPAPAEPAFHAPLPIDPRYGQPPRQGGSGFGRKGL